MKITELLLAEVDREAVGIRKTLERVPEGKNGWKPHEKSMSLGSRATIVATIPAWLDMVVNMDELDINLAGGPKYKPQEWKTRRDLLDQFEASLKKGTRSIAENDRQPPAEYQVAYVVCGQADERTNALCRNPRWRIQPHGTSSRTVNRIFEAERRKGSSDLRSVRR